ncbi:hypothetical protein BVC93_01400 [Mycobacterium sp. MS1601]|uniref:PE-PPE domain-containing protein n=1 Tax=Mycobacterium sp. MS1601 TaxID=1936029 RepID=UPI0009790F12|nr:PE-PPE domain-containing protein [Mycobacterium sp. MS1601]AQA01305.1 hypothetical protein BVC93_01400 [Mycobacterium sp. MS1601]
MGKVFKRAVTPTVIGGMAMATVAAVALTTTVPQVASREKVALTATITPGSATNWNAQGIDRFYGIDWNATYGDTAIAPFRLIQFWQGAQNILSALDAAQGDDEPDVVVSSGRGAGNASAVITWLAHTDPDGARLNDTLWILDNNVDRPNGGYATRYPFFALVGVNPIPVPNDLEGVQILDVGYQYAWNSSAPTYISNLPALLNAIIAYAYRYQQQDKLPIPEEILRADGTLDPNASGYYIVRTDGTVERHDFDDPESKVTTVYVTYEVKGLPMLQPIRDFGGDFGNAFADVVEPVLTVLVNASYKDNNPLSDPSVYTPMQLFAPPKVWATAAQQLPGAIDEGLQRLREHMGAKPAAKKLEPTAAVAEEAPDEDALVAENTESTENTDDAAVTQTRTVLSSGNRGDDEDAEPQLDTDEETDEDLTADIEPAGDDEIVSDDGQSVDEDKAAEPDENAEKSTDGVKDTDKSTDPEKDSSSGKAVE